MRTPIALRVTNAREIKASPARADPRSSWADWMALGSPRADVNLKAA